MTGPMETPPVIVRSAPCGRARVRDDAPACARARTGRRCSGESDAIRGRRGSSSARARRARRCPRTPRPAAPRRERACRESTDPRRRAPARAWLRVVPRRRATLRRSLAATRSGELRGERVRQGAQHVDGGAQGPMQFLPATWAGIRSRRNVHDPHDAILGAANDLAANGAPTTSGALGAVQPLDARTSMRCSTARTASHMRRRVRRVLRLGRVHSGLRSAAAGHGSESFRGTGFSGA